MKAIVRIGQWYFTTNYAFYKDINGNDSLYIEGLEMELLRIILQQLNMTFFFVPTPRGFERGNSDEFNLVRTMIAKEAFIALGDVGYNILGRLIFDTTNPYSIMSIRWYVP
jgi:hypothetical protein